MPADPAADYRARLARWSLELDAQSKADARLAVARLATFGAGVILIILVWRAALIPWTLAAPVLVFVALAIRHDVAIRARERAAALITFYERGLHRIEDRWIGTGQTGERFREDSHPYADDLDLFGRGSLFELLSLARTRTGEETLASWLKTRTAAEQTAARQVAVAELAPRLDLREELALARGIAGDAIHGRELEAWATAPPALAPSWLRYVAFVITALTLGTLAVWYATGLETPFYFAIAAQAAFSLPHVRRVERLLHHAGGPARELAALSQALALLERETFSSPALIALQAGMRSHGRDASRAIRRLNRLSEMHDWQHNLIFMLVALLLMWSTHLAWAIEAWRRRHGTQVAGWLEAVGQLEALASLSAYAYEHPQDPFPELLAIDSDGTRRIGRFEAESLGHPLVPADRMVRNDVRLAREQQLLVVSGSNMSGKSTLLRTVGINVVLAQIGAPVRARFVRLGPLAVGATLRIHDSLQEGRSRFYAEISRISQLAVLAKADAPPLLFLLDEIFHGTNSHDRLVGASGVLRSFVDHGAIGLITTHDLALTAVVDELQPRAANIHFEDWFDGREMRFDYRIKAGPVTRSNALALMRAVGLDVDQS